MISYGQLVARVTQAANMFHALGVGASDVVSFLLPLLPQSFFTLFGAEAAGIANPVNPLLETHQIAEILRGGRHQGTDRAWTHGGQRHMEQGRRSTRPTEAAEGNRSNQRFGRRGEFNLLLRCTDKPAAGRLPGERPTNRRRRCRRLLSHRRYHRHAEACSPNSRKPSISGLGMQSDAQVLTGPQPSVRHAAIPCGWRSNANPCNLFEWMLSGGAVASWMAKSGRTEKCLGAG